jgi:hypothetical protein
MDQISVLEFDVEGPDILTHQKIALSEKNNDVRRCSCPTCKRDETLKNTSTMEGRAGRREEGGEVR